MVLAAGVMASEVGVRLAGEFCVLFAGFSHGEAPFGEWSDPRHQDGCEEAAALMAVAAAAGDSRFIIQGTILDKQYAKEEIENIWDWEVETYGGARDTSPQDTAKRVIRGEFFDKENS